MFVTDDPAGTAPTVSGRGHTFPPRGAARTKRWGARRFCRALHLAVVVRWQATRLDRQLADGISPHTSHALALRARVIIDRRNRIAVARGLGAVLRSASEHSPRFTAAIPPNRHEVLRARPVIEAIQRRLRGVEPVTARGMAMLRAILTEAASSLYRPDERGALSSDLRAAAAALDPSDRWD